MEDENKLLALTEKLLETCENIKFLAAKNVQIENQNVVLPIEQGTITTMTETVLKQHYAHTGHYVDPNALYKDITQAINSSNWYWALHLYRQSPVYMQWTSDESYLAYGGIIYAGLGEIAIAEGFYQNLIHHYDSSRFIPFLEKMLQDREEN